ncbi:hypothetical protein [Derxia gummosa]|uniref:Uncharacterized protein n=1 Tax=Derxia gummosa DSM 723 TaxID=1121388 RepID=A0A8B6XC85_9BURK|nr:hypothetical protein [Derxia gummosa]
MTAPFSCCPTFDRLPPIDFSQCLGESTTDIGQFHDRAETIDFPDGKPGIAPRLLRDCKEAAD